MKMSSLDVKRIPRQLIKTITNDFSEEKKVGSGGYGEVYKAVLDGEEVAVKKLYPVHGLHNEAFQNAFRSLMKVQHRNIVRLIGYCYEKVYAHVEYNGELVFAEITEQVLCFEYMQCGSLFQHISAESCIHDWPTTYRIIKGTCEGLHYLHKGRGETNYIYHLDLNPDNILLDKNLVPKIGGFSLSMLIDDPEDCQIKSIKGTIGFMPPEYIHHGIISTKNDVFSLGVVIFCMMSGRDGYDDYYDSCCHQEFSENNRQEFIERVQDYWKKKMLAAAGYTSDETGLPGVTKCIEIAMSCVDTVRDKRPTITEIIDDLNKLDTPIEEMIEEMPMKDQEPPIGQTGSKPALPLQYLKDITNNFCDERILGRGGFGVVYKGVQQDGQMIAVKKLLQAMPKSLEQFENEVNLLMKLEHPNIVRLVGYCYETTPLNMPHEGKFIFVWNTNSLLCLECLPNGSLDEYISDASSGLNWHTRCKIIEGISYGLLYLHEQSNNPIIHLDLKPANILLDENMLPKITDFGLSRLFDQNQTIQTAITHGTLGYMPPEYVRGIITPMSDIFSLGVIIMEIITGHRDYPYEYDIRTSSEFIELEVQKWRTMLQNEPGYTSLETDCQQIRRCIQIGLICVNPDRRKRPTMKKIINMFQGLESMNLYISNELSMHDIKEEP